MTCTRRRTCSRRLPQRLGAASPGRPAAFVAVLADPFDTDLMTWLETLSERPLQWQLALPGDIQAYLSRQEESARALDTGEAAETGTQRDGRVRAAVVLRTFFT